MRTSRIGPIDLLRALSAMRRHRHTSREALVRYQDARLRRLVGHAYEAVPYFRGLLDRHGVRPEHVRTTADLPLIPLTSKRDLQQAAPAEVVARGVDPSWLISYMTSGSEGEPLTVRRTWLEERLGRAFALRALRDFGLRCRDLRVSVGADGGRLVPNDPRNWEGPQRLLRSLGLYRKAHVDFRAPAGELFDRLIALRPDVLSSSPSLLSWVGGAMARERPGALPPPRFIVCAQEVLTPLQRGRISESFGARVVEMYGTHELGPLAWECSRGIGLHVADDSVVLEVLKDGRPAAHGEVGEVVATRLHAYAMPFLRYRLGDLVTRGPAPCPCGAPFSTILTIQGRMVDSFRMPDGRLLQPYELVITIHQLAARWVGQFQITQETRARVSLRVAPRVPPTPDEIAALEAAIRARLGAAVDFRLLLVREIPPEINGKFRLSRSFVQSDYDQLDWDRQRAADLASLGRMSSEARGQFGR